MRLLVYGDLGSPWEDWNGFGDKARSDSVASCCSQIPASSSKDEAVDAADIPPAAPGPPPPPPRETSGLDTLESLLFLIGDPMVNGKVDTVEEDAAP